MRDFCLFLLLLHHLYLEHYLVPRRQSRPCPPSVTYASIWVATRGRETLFCRGARWVQSLALASLTLFPLSRLCIWRSERELIRAPVSGLDNQPQHQPVQTRTATPQLELKLSCKTSPSTRSTRTRTRCSAPSPVQSRTRLSPVQSQLKSVQLAPIQPHKASLFSPKPSRIFGRVPQVNSTARDSTSIRERGRTQAH